MENIKYDAKKSKGIKENIINKLIENEKCMQDGEITFNEDEMNAILDRTMAKYV